MTEVKYTEDHEWIRMDTHDTATIGITDYAQDQLGDVVYVELPAIGREVRKGEEAAVVESVKAASDVKMPASGTVVEVNENLAEHPELVNRDPAGAGWFLKLRLANPRDLENLMSEPEYRAYIARLK
jgi:glycine cleavage system H protein